MDYVLGKTWKDYVFDKINQICEDEREMNQEFFKIVTRIQRSALLIKHMLLLEWYGIWSSKTMTYPS